MALDVRTAIAKMRTEATAQMEQAKGKVGTDRLMCTTRAALLVRLAQEFEDDLDEGD